MLNQPFRKEPKMFFYYWLIFMLYWVEILVPLCQLWLLYMAIWLLHITEKNEKNLGSFIFQPITKVHIVELHFYFCHVNFCYILPHILFLITVKQFKSFHGERIHISSSVDICNLTLLWNLDFNFRLCKFLFLKLIINTNKMYIGYCFNEFFKI